MAIYRHGMHQKTKVNCNIVANARHGIDKDEKTNIKLFLTSNLGPQFC